MWRAVPTAYWNYVVGIDWIRAVGTNGSMVGKGSH
jgi:hypothetical protein